MTRRAPMGDPS
ncbi:unnamed protein product, partial [Didymodactylos carnosus]